MVQLAGLIFAFLAGWLLSTQRREKKAASRALLVLTNGKTVQVKEVTVEDGLFRCAKNEIYPDAGAMRAYFGRDTYYLLAVEPVALVTHKRLERLRPAIVSGSLFRPGGELAELVRWASIAALIVCVLWMSSSFGGLQDAVIRQGVTIESMRETLDKPLVSVPASSSPTPTLVP